MIWRHAVAFLWLAALISSSSAVVELKSSIVLIPDCGAPLKMLLHEFPKCFAHYRDGDAAPSKALNDSADRKTKSKKNPAAESGDEREKLMRLFDQRDPDMDDHVTLEEFHACRTGAPGVVLERHLRAFECDGEIIGTKSELPSASKPNRSSK